MMGTSLLSIPWAINQVCISQSNFSKNIKYNYFEQILYVVKYPILIIFLFHFAGWFCSCSHSFNINGWDLSLQLLLDTQMC